MKILLFHQMRIRKYYYLIFFPIYSIIGLFRALGLLQKKYFIFGAGGGSQFIDNSKYLYLLNSTKKDCIWITHSPELAKNLQLRGIRAYLSYNLKGIYYQIFAKMVIISHGTFDVLPPLLLNIPILQYWHGYPIKKIGLDANSEKNYLIGDMLWSAIYKIYPHLNNYYCNFFVDNSLSPEYLRSFIKSQPKIVQLPYPRLQQLLSKENSLGEKDNLQLCSLKKLKAEGKKIIVYMPTYREGEINQKLLHNNLLKLKGIFEKDKRFIFVYKSHFILSEHLIDNNDHFITYTSSDPYPLLAIASGMISDYSSVIFDFLITGKPIYIFPFDLDNYRKNPGYYFNPEDKFGEMIAYDPIQVFEKISSEIFGGKSFLNFRESIFNQLFRDSFYCEGPWNIHHIEQLLKAN